MAGNFGLDNTQLHVQAHLGEYDEVERHFDVTWLSALILKGLTPKLIEVIAQGNIVVTSGEEGDLLIHIDSIQIHYESPIDRVSVLAGSRSSRVACGFWVRFTTESLYESIAVEYHLADEFGRERKFNHDLRGTENHELTRLMLDLKKVINRSSKGTLSENIREWAKNKQKEEAK